MVNVQSMVGTFPDTQAEAGTEKASNTRRPFVLCSRHLERRREWINLPEGEAKQDAQTRLFQSVAFCAECQDLSWSGQAPPQPAEQRPQQPAQDTYSWWRDVMGQP